MEKGLLKVSVLQVIYILLYIALVTLFNVFKIDISLTIVTLLYWFGISLLTFLFFGYERRKSLFSKDISMNVIIDCLGYFLIIYIFGIFIGFVRNIYSNQFIHIIKNMYPYFLLIIFQELTRYMMVCKCGKRSFGYVFTALMFIVINSVFYIQSYDLNVYKDVLDFFAEVFIPSVFLNITFSYIACKEGFWPGIIYRIFLELYVFILPIFPDMGSLVQSISQVVLLLIILFQSINLLEKKSKDVNKNSGLYRFLANTFIVLFALVFSLLVSGVTSFVMIAIGSNSMSPVIRKGDAILYKKVDIEDVEIDDILVFNYDGRVVVHRIIDINEDDKIVIYTKGDNNEVEDGWKITEDMVIGKYLFKIPFIGWPSVWIGENILK